MSGTAAPDPRVEKVMISRHAYNAGFLSPQQEWLSAERFVASLDTADRAAGVMRVRTDDATVEKIARKIAANYDMDAGAWFFCAAGVKDVLDVLEALATQ